MRVVVLGADGYLGWPTALHLSARGHDVVAADSLIRLRWDVLCGAESLVPIASMTRRVARWQEVSGKQIVCDKLALTLPSDATALIDQHSPTERVPFAAQLPAP